MTTIEELCWRLKVNVTLLSLQAQQDLTDLQLRLMNGSQGE